MQHRARLHEETDLGYLYRSRAGNLRYAGEACAAALEWLDGVLPGEPMGAHH